MQSEHLGPSSSSGLRSKILVTSSRGAIARVTLSPATKSENSHHHLSCNLSLLESLSQHEETDIIGALVNLKSLLALNLDRFVILAILKRFDDFHALALGGLANMLE